MAHSDTRIPGTTMAFIVLVIDFALLALVAGLCAWGAQKAVMALASRLAG